MLQRITLLRVADVIRPVTGRFEPFGDPSSISFDIILFTATSGVICLRLCACFRETLRCALDIFWHREELSISALLATPRRYVYNLLPGASIQPSFRFWDSLATVAFGVRSRVLSQHEMRSSKMTCSIGVGIEYSLRWCTGI